MAQDIIADAALIQAGAFLARATYGAEYIDPRFWVDGDGDAEKNDDYRGYVASTQGWKLLDHSDLPGFDTRNGKAGFTSGGLYDAQVFSLTSSSFDAQGLLAVKNGDTLVLSFRGTDGEDPAVLSGQAWTAQGLAANYKAFKPLIAAALDYVKAHSEITDVVVSGHSLGGALADVFAITDADSFRAVRPGHVTIVSLASSGIPESLPVFLNGIDQEAVTMGLKTILDAGGVEVDVPYIRELHRPDGYFSFVNDQDRAHFPEDFPDVPEKPGLVPIATLKGNLQFGGETIFRVPNIHNADVVYYPPLEHPADFRGMGAEHSSALLWANIHGLLNDDLFAFYTGQALTMGITDYEHLKDDDGSPISLFEGYLYLGDRARMSDHGSRSLTGTAAADYIMGLDGADRLASGGGNDLLSGGRGRDILAGGTGADTLSGGSGADTLSGNAGADTFHYAAAGQSKGASMDTVLDFTHGVDKIDLTAIDADRGTAGMQHFAFIGKAGFDGAAEIRAIQSGDDTILRFNLDADSTPEMAILLKHVNAASLTADDFIL